MADRYWVGGTNTWNTTAGTKWATTSGGAGGASAPGSGDDVFLNAASGAGTITISNASCRNLNCTGFTGTLAGASTLNAYGSILLVAGMTYSATSLLALRATTSVTITAAGKSLGGMNLLGVGGTWTLQDTVTATSLTHSEGTFDLNGQTINVPTYSSPVTSTRVLTFGSGVLNLTGATGTLFTFGATNYTVNAGTGTIRVSGTGSGTRTVSLNSTSLVFPSLEVTAGGSTLNVTNGNIDNLTITSGFTGTWSNQNLVIRGGATLPATGPTFSSGSNIWDFRALTGTKSITTNGQSCQWPWRLGSGVTSSATWELQDSLTVSALTLTSGTLNAGAHAVTPGSFTSAGSLAREAQLGSDTWTLSGAWTVSGTNLTMTPGTSVIRLTAASALFTGGGHTYYDLWLSTSGGTKVIQGSNTFNDLTVAAPSTLEFGAGTTTHVTDWGVNGTAGNLIVLRTESDAASYHYLVADGAPIVGDYLDIKRSIASPDADWSATNSVDSGSNVGWFTPVFARYSGTHTLVAIGDIDTAVVAASSGDVLVLASGTHTLTEDVPVGVTLRGASCGSETIIQCENITPLGGNTFRDLTFQVASDPAAAVLNPSSTTWFENCIFDECPVYYGGPDAGETVTFSRCTFQAGASTGQICASADDGVGSVQWLHCLFKDQGNLVTAIYANDFSVPTTGMSFLLHNCTFILVAGSAAVTVDTGDGVIEYWNNVVYSPVFTSQPFGDGSGHDSGGGNFYQDAYVLPPTYSYLTQVRDLGIDTVTGSLRNDSPARFGAQDNLTIYTDRNYLPWASLGQRSSGCFQWRLDSSAIYRPWFLDPTDGFTFGYEPGVVPPTKTTEDLTAGVTQVNSHLEVACLIRKLVYDLAHPSVCECYVSWDGYYRILVHEFEFDLTNARSALLIFGNTGLGTGLTDTG